MDFTNSNTPHDRVLIVGEENTKFYVYAGHLSFCYEYFRSLFNGDFEENSENEIELKNLDVEDFHSFLKALIPGNKNAVTAENYSTILTCASRFHAADVISMCEKFVVDDFDRLDKIDLFKMAFEYNWDALKDRLTEDIIQKTLDEKCPNSCDSVIRENRCLECNVFVYPARAIQLDKSSFLVENQEKLSTSPTKIQAFIFNVLLNEAKKY